MNEVKASFHWQWKTYVDSGNNKLKYCTREESFAFKPYKVQNDYALIKDGALQQVTPSKEAPHVASLHMDCNQSLT